MNDSHHDHPKTMVILALLVLGQMLFIGWAMQKADNRIIDTVCARDADPAACRQSWEESK